MGTKIIGQDTLITEVSKIFNIFKASKCNIRPHFILTGESGSGKSYTIKTLTKQTDCAFIEINAAQLTKEGTSGNSLAKTLSPLIQLGTKPCIIFVDEFDKLFVSGNSNDSGAHETSTGVQNEFLKILESDTCSVFGDYGKYVNVNVKNTLFVFAGAFNGEKNMNLDRLREVGIKTEFLGRVGLVYNTNSLTLEDLNKIVDNSELLTMYLKLFTDIKRQDVITKIKEYIKLNYENNTIGARIINTLINQYFIKGGDLGMKEAEEITFQTKLKL